MASAVAAPQKQEDPVPTAPAGNGLTAPVNAPQQAAQAPQLQQQVGTGFVNIDRYLQGNQNAGQVVSHAAGAAGHGAESDFASASKPQTDFLNGDPTKQLANIGTSVGPTPDDLNYQQGANEQALQAFGNTATAGRQLAAQVGVTAGYTPQLDAIDRAIYGGNASKEVGQAAKNYGIETGREANSQNAINSSLAARRGYLATMAQTNKDALDRNSAPPSNAPKGDIASGLGPTNTYSNAQTPQDQANAINPVLKQTQQTAAVASVLDQMNKKATNAVFNANQGPFQFPGGGVIMASGGAPQMPSSYTSGGYGSSTKPAQTDQMKLDAITKALNGGNIPGLANVQKKPT